MTMQNLLLMLCYILSVPLVRKFYLSRSIRAVGILSHVFSVSSILLHRNLKIQVIQCNEFIHLTTRKKELEDNDATKLTNFELSILGFSVENSKEVFCLQVLFYEIPFLIRAYFSHSCSLTLECRKHSTFFNNLSHHSVRFVR